MSTQTDLDKPMTRQLSNYGHCLDKLLATVVLRCEAQRELIPEKKLSLEELEQTRNRTNRIFTEFYAGVTRLKSQYAVRLTE